VTVFGPDHATMMTEAGYEDVPVGSGAKVLFVGSELREKLIAAADSEGFMPVRVTLPGTQGRGRLGLIFEESIERSLELRGACPPGIGASADIDASLSDQLYRARLLGARGLALAIERLESIANQAGALDAEDSAVLRWWVMTARERPLRLYFDSHDESLGIYTAPTHLGKLVRHAETGQLRPSAPPPVDAQLQASVRSMQAMNSYLTDSEVEVDSETEVEMAVGETEAAAESAAAAEAETAADNESAAATETESATAVEAETAANTESAAETESESAPAAEAETAAETESAAAIESETRTILDSITPTDAAGAAPSEAASTPESEVDRADCSSLVSQLAAAPVTPPAPATEALNLDTDEIVASAPLHPEAAQRWREWSRMLEQARGPKPLGVVEQLYVNAYVPLADAVARGIAGAEASEVLETWSSSFARSYGEAFDALRLRGKRPMMVLDVAEVSLRLARLHGARSTQLVLVDGMRFDLGIRVEERMRKSLGQKAAMTERLLLWSALPSNTATQLELLGRGPEGLKDFEPPSDSNAFVAHGRSAATLRRVRTGSRDVMKLDMVESRLNEPGICSPAGLDCLADDVAQTLSSALLKFAPRTLAVVFGDHGFVADDSQNGSSPARHGGASPEEVLVPAFAWLVGATH
jgi:hypothetical protein